MLSFFRHILDNTGHHHFIDYLAEVTSGVSAIALFPQLFALLRGAPADGLSPLSFFLIAASGCVWLAYGIHRHTPPLVISSTLNTVAATGILVMIYVRT